MIAAPRDKRTLEAAASASFFFRMRSSTLNGVAAGRLGAPHPDFFFLVSTGGAGDASSGGGGGGAVASGGGGGAAESSGGGGGGEGGHSIGSGGGPGGSPGPFVAMPSAVTRGRIEIDRCKVGSGELSHLEILRRAAPPDAQSRAAGLCYLVCKPRVSNLEHGKPETNGQHQVLYLSLLFQWKFSLFRTQASTLMQVPEMRRMMFLLERICFKSLDRIGHLEYNDPDGSPCPDQVWDAG